MSTGRRPFWRGSVGTQIRWLVGVLVALVTVGAIASVVAIEGQSKAVRELTLVFGPGADANATTTLSMAQADTSWQLTAAGAEPDPPATAYRSTVEAGLHDVATALEHPDMHADDEEVFDRLVSDQRSAASAWFDAVAAATSRGGTPARADVASVDAAYARFTQASEALGEQIRLEQVEARLQSRRGSQVAAEILVGVSVVLVLLLVAAGLGLDLAVARPIARLREVVRRQAEDDVILMANQEEGALEVRMLARDFNDLTRANARLVDQQAAVLEMQELVLDVGRRVRAANDVEEALQRVCARLGAGLGADRVLLYTFGDDGRGIDDRLQWHRPELPDLPPLPRSLAQQAGAVNDELRHDVGFFAVPDLLALRADDEERVRAFHRATGAQSLLMLTVGTGGRGLGLLSIMMVDGPRRWHRHEIQAAQQCAAIAGQSIIALRLTQMQDEQVRRLTELDRQKTDFMATISHELRTPLTSIAGYLELLADGDFGAVSSGQTVALDIIGRNATRLRGLIEDLLVLNKIEASGLQSESEDVTVADLLRVVAETMEPVAVAGGVELVCQPVPDDLLVHVDRSQLERALINLGSNAVKFTPRGGQVVLSAERSGESTVVTVHDTGIGIPSADLARLSERFFRAGNATAKAIPGTGLGLAIVRAIVEGHGGELVIASVEGEGTTMQVVLPVARPRTPQSPDAPASTPAPAPATHPATHPATR